jgi:hypothetical protein
VLSILFKVFPIFRCKDDFGQLQCTRAHYETIIHTYRLVDYSLILSCVLYHSNLFVSLSLSLSVCIYIYIYIYIYVRFEDKIFL